MGSQVRHCLYMHNLHGESVKRQLLQHLPLRHLALLFPVQAAVAQVEFTQTRQRRAP